MVMSTKPAYRYTLPGQDEKQVHVQGFFTAFVCMAHGIQERIENERKACPSVLVAGVSTPYRTPEKIQVLGEEMAKVRLESINEYGVLCTNDMKLFQALFVEHFIKGDTFCCYALSHGLLQILEDVDDSFLTEMSFRFAYEMYMHQSIYEYDDYKAEHNRDMDGMVKKVHRIYRRYQALN
jgi:hypothetical protein